MAIPEVGLAIEEQGDVCLARRGKAGGPQMEN